jgi:hypothetical protein
MKGKFSFSPLREDFREKEKGIFVSTLRAVFTVCDNVKTRSRHTMKKVKWWRDILFGHNRTFETFAACP